ncbi:MAG: sigma-70 family RNA polymerase sigma factor, partial [Holophagales bacterium]|nr:sigma-70 family RNA polymerase sigma factor [Holophagales bacterium]
MRVWRFFSERRPRLRNRGPGDPGPATDRELVEELRRDPGAAWPRFLDRYAGEMLGWLHDLGFDDDQAMDRFVFVCEKLAADDCRRLRRIDHLGERGELVPWLRQVVRNLAVSRTWAETGRPRLPRPVEALGPLEQEVFRLHFWSGCRASESHARLLAAGHEVELIQVYAALEAVYGVLGGNRRWRLSSGLERRRPPLSLDRPAASEDREGSPEPAEPRFEGADPESAALAAEAADRLASALAGLTPEERLLVRLRFEDELPHAEIADLLGEPTRAVRRRLRR